MTASLREESVRTLYTQARRSLAASFVVTSYMAGSAWPFTSPDIILAWVACVAVMQVLREWLIRRFFAASPSASDIDRWARYYTLHQLVTGIIWGATIVLFAHPNEPISVALTLSCLYACAAGSVPAQAYNPPTLYALVVPMFVAVSVRLVAVGTPSYILMGVASALYGVTMLAFCRVQARALDEGFRIRFENQALLEALTNEKAQAENARRDAERANLAKSQFLAAASHDLRQPLYALTLFSASLASLKLDDKTRDVVGNIQDSIAAMESLFTGLLDVSRLDAGVVTTQIAPVSIDGLFDRLSQYFHPVAVERDIDLRFRSDGEWVMSDETLLEQVLSNLVANALRYTVRGAVLIAARKRGARIELEVWDSGIGIAPSDRQRIFEEFVQLDNPERDRRKGLGLGLSIAQRSARLLDAKILVVSRPGCGSRFGFSQARTVAPAPAGLAMIERRLAGERKWALHPGLPLLVVDDDRAVRTALAALLTQWGVPFDISVTGEDALQRIETGACYGMVLADYRLPGRLNGLDLIAAIAERHTAPRPRFALITGDFDPSLIGAAQDRGVPLLHKPVRATRLRDLLGLSAAA